MKAIDDPGEADMSTLGFGIGSRLYSCESCAFSARVRSYPFLAITGFMFFVFAFIAVPALLKIYPDHGLAFTFSALVLITVRLALSFFKLVYENIAYPAIEPRSKVIRSGVIALIAALASAPYLFQNFDKRLLALAVFLFVGGGISLVFIKGVITLVRCPAQQGWSFQLGDFVRVLIIAVIFGIALSTGESDILKIIQ